MSGLFRIAVAAALVAGFGSIAQAQSRWGEPAPTAYYGLSEGRSVAVDRADPRISPVPPSRSQTVMGLRVPR